MQQSDESPLWLTCGLECVIAIGLWTFQKEGEAISLFAAAAVTAAAAAYPLRHRLATVLRARTIYRTTRIYFSFAYLYRIRTRSGRHLLVKHKENREYQPVGGVFKFHPSAKLMDQFNRMTVSILPFSDPHRQHDLRGFVDGKHLPDLMKWFDSKEDRELAPLREFYEEMSVAPGFLDTGQFMYIDFRHVGTVVSPIIKMDRHDLGYGVFVFEVYDFVANPEQADALEALAEADVAGADDAVICFVTADEIMRLGFTRCGVKQPLPIARHTKTVLLMRWN